MLVKDEFLNRARRAFGLNLYEVKIWTALLSRGISTAGELSDIGNVPRSRAYDILESLTKKGFVITKAGKPLRYVAVEPQNVVENVKKFITQKSKDDAKKLDKLKSTDLANQLETLHKQGLEFIEPTDLAGVIRGRSGIYTHLTSVLKKAQKSVLLVTTAEGLLSKLDSLRTTLEKVGKGGVKIKIAAPVNKATEAAVNDLTKFAEVKNLDKISARFCIIDGKDLMLMLMPNHEVHPSYDVGVWVNTPFFASAMESMFNIIWNDLESAEKILKK